MRRLSPKLLIQNTIPPALLMYFGWAWRRTLFRGAYEYICVHLGQPWIGALYGLATTLVPAMSALYLRLYFLPASQSLPPRHPPTDLLDLATVFECVPPTRALRAGHALIPRGSEAEDVGLLARCTRDTCAGRWKPARARHCSECGVCRCAFDHHCAFFANCLTAPHLPTFLALCFGTPAVVLLLSLPFLPSLLPRVLAAWRASYTAQEALQWWNWKWSWVVAAGPVGRYAVGLALGWHALDVADGGGPAQLLTLEIGLLVGISYILAAITSALGYSTLKNVRAGALTVDYERVRAHTRALAAADAFRAKGLPVPLELEDKIARFAPVHYFFIPVTNPQYAGVVIRAPANPYNLGASNNFELVVSRGFGARWILPWNALCTGIPERETHNWPVAPAALRYMKEEAERIVREVAEEEDVGNVSVQSAPRRPGPDRLAYTRL